MLLKINVYFHLQRLFLFSVLCFSDSTAMSNEKVHPLKETSALSKEGNDHASISSDYKPTTVVPIDTGLSLPEEPFEPSEEDADMHEPSPNRMTSVRSIAGEQKRKVVYCHFQSNCIVSNYPLI